MTDPSQLISVTEFSEKVGVPYHRLLVWIKRDKYGLRQHASKVGHGWIISTVAVEELKKKIDTKGK